MAKKTAEEKIKFYQKQIDDLDTEIACRLEHRLDLVGKIGDEKKKLRLQILNISREKEVFENVRSSVVEEEKEGLIISVFKKIIKVSREHQREL